MTLLQNLHVHCSFCDGKDSPEEVVQTAIEKGFASIGFSSHSYMYYSPWNSISDDSKWRYQAEIARLKAQYADQIEIFCGLEMDMYSKVDLTGYDYVIGSVHYLDIDGKKVGFDRTEERVREVIDTYFHGDGLQYAKAYYETVATLPQYAHYDIIGHFDLITKHSEKADFFDENDPRYQRYAIEALESLQGKIPLFEVNTGAIARGYRTTPYPSPFLLREMKRLGFGAIITSDCHDRNALDCHYKEAAQLLKSCGFDEQYILTKDGFCAVGIEE